MLRLVPVIVAFSISIAPAYGRVVIFWQDGFPTTDSQPIARETLLKSFGGGEATFAGIEDLKKADTLKDADLLVLPYGSSFPVDAWEPIFGYLDEGGNLLTLGGRPLFVPVAKEDGRFVPRREQNTYSRLVGIAHTYEVPQKNWVSFQWDEASAFPEPVEVRAKRVFVAAPGRDRGAYRGLGYLLNASGERIAAPVVEEDYISQNEGGLRGARIVFLNFEPEPGYWDSAAGIAFLQAVARRARQGATFLHVEMINATVAEGEIPQVVVQLRNVRRQRSGLPQSGSVRVELLDGNRPLSSSQLTFSGSETAKEVMFRKDLPPGLYYVKASYEDSGEVREVYQTGFWVRDLRVLKRGIELSTGDTYFRKNGAAFLPFGTNYFSTDDFREGFLGGNAFVWERDFAEMERNGVTFVRTGVWSNHADLLDRLTGGVKERFLRGLEAYLHSAARHNIHVNFTFYAFDPQTVRRYPGEEPLQFGPGSNPYTDPVAVQAQKNYIQSVVNPFHDLPCLSWDLINEPSFSNPRRLWRGNTPNADPTERSAWNKWLEKRYGDTGTLARAWNTTPEAVGVFGTIPLPEPESLELARNDNSGQVRAIDYNLFAQDMFRQWVAGMVAAIRSTGSKQLVDVGHDEGGVADRLLNQFYGDAGVAFTTNHTWWRDDALLWDSVAAKRPGMPNLIGETGVQPVSRMDTSWRWDEVGALGLYERKLALGLAAANAGSLQWDWAKGDTYGIKRSDGSNKLWQDILRGMALFAQNAAPHITHARAPEVAIVLPQSLQLSVFNDYALQAQQQCVRALFHYARASAYVVGEYQTQLLGNPKLIILPSPWIFTQQAWEAILEKVGSGAVLLVSGRFDADEHFHATRRQKEAGLAYEPDLLATRENLVEWPGGRAFLSYPGDKCTYLERGFLPDGRTFAEVKRGQGKILYFSLPIELSDNTKAIGEIYRMALAKAQVAPSYTTDVEDPGILISPTDVGNATLYVLTSESSVPQTVSFKDSASGKSLAGKLGPGRAALLLVGKSGEVLADYNWKPGP
jgi:hypothetical protein